MKYIIGIDIGGTNTDAVLIDDHENDCSARKSQHFGRYRNRI